MKLPAVLALAGIATLVSTALSSRTDTAPTSRVVGLLQSLKAKLEADLQAEEELYDKYFCWHKSVTEQKAASNTAAEGRVSELTTLISDIDAGKFEFTTERVDLEKEISTLQSELSTAEAQRKSEKQDYDAAKAEMDAAIDALDEAISGLENATSGALVQARSILERRWSFEKALALGRGVLSDADVKYLHKAMNGQVPEVDWNKLNRKADFKMKYKARSGEIISTLKSLLSTFTANRDEATDRETKAAASYDTLKGKKEQMLGEAQDALTALELENGARGMNKEEAQQEIDALNAQVTADKTFISDTNTAFDTKKQEWEARKEVRNKEITAISQAIAVLHSDDARDLFKKSFQSQGYTFMQLHAESPRAVQRAASIVANLAAASPQDGQLALLARLARNEPTESEAIAQVVSMIDSMVTQLNADEAKDLTDKETCETDLSTIASEAKATANKVDEESESITRDSEKVVTLQKEAKEQQDTIDEATEQLASMKTQREAETASYNADKADDLAAVGLIQQAHDILKNWNALVQTGSGSANFLQIGSASFAREERSSSWGAAVAPASPQAVRRLAVAEIHQGQSAKHRQPVETEAGKAPPPPPDTWTEAYTGASGESAGILGILELLKADVEQDIALADKAESDADSAYTTAKSALEDGKSKAQDDLDVLNGDIADYQGKVSDGKTARATTYGTLDSQTTEYEAKRTACDFILVNYKVRVSNRQIEKDGLLKAKAILQGATFR
mmetsp:Transcript_141499/g.271619  ORF Transcript_141499/g.271619 Transcript_141499/m.271619 type:complete len:741 (-) Transcript_141499:95-2317(-)